MTRDAVPVFVDAIVFWVVWNPQRHPGSAELVRGHLHERQDGAREAVGRRLLTEMLTDRESLGHELRSSSTRRPDRGA